MKGVETRYEDVDLVIVRENTEDLYAGIEHMVGPDAAESIKIITRAASERIARYAFDYAVANGRRKVTAVHKANIMKLSDGLFLESCRTVAADYDGPDRVRGPHRRQHVHAARPEAGPVRRARAAEPVRRHRQRPVRPGLVGGLGVAPGANIGDRGRRLRAGPRLGAQVRRPGQGQPDRADPVGRADAPPPRLPGRRPSASRPRSARSSPRAAPTTYDLGGTPGRSGFADAIIERLGGDRPRHRRPDDRQLPASLRAATQAAQAPRPVGLGATRRRDRWWVAPGVQATLFTICATYLFVSGILLTPLFGTPYEVDGYLSPLFSPLIRPDWLPTWISPGLFILWIPLGFRATCYYYRKAYYRFYFADPPGCAVGEPTIHRALRDGDGASRSSSRTSTATSCTSRSSRCSSCGSTRRPSLRSGRPVADRARRRSSCSVNAAPADRLLAVVPLAAPPRRRPARLLLVHAPRRRSATRSGSGSRR